MTTDRMKRAVKFCEDWCAPEFTGDINNFHEVSAFLGKYLNEAKDIVSYNRSCRYHFDDYDRHYGNNFDYASYNYDNDYLAMGDFI